MSGERLNVFATRMTLTMMKNRAKGAKAGHKLLKRKADALTMKFRSMAKIIKDVRKLSPRKLSVWLSGAGGGGGGENSHSHRDKP